MNVQLSTCYYYNQLVGWLKISAIDKGITEISFTDGPSKPDYPNRLPILDKLTDQLDDYFRGILPTFDVPVHYLRGTAFQQRVWEELTRIRAGQTRSYAEIARAIGAPKACRAVGSANGKNPVPIIIPCHRVVNSNGSLGGYSSGTHIKKALLEHEKKFFFPVSTETEAKLVIVSEDPSKIRAALDKIDSLSKFPLEQSRKIAFQDIYFDLPDRALSRKKWALRLRQYPRSEKLAMKGPAVQLADGSVSRPELETVFDLHALERIVKLAVDIGVNLEMAQIPKDMDTGSSLKRMGLEVIQKRHTNRTTRAIIDPEKLEQIGELAVDEVSFSAGTQDFKHYEIEIESWGGPGSPMVKNSVDFLKELFGSSLMAWSIDKLTTIGIICEAVERGRLARSSSRKSLTREDYELIVSESDRR